MKHWDFHAVAIIADIPRERIEAFIEARVATMLAHEFDDLMWHELAEATEFAGMKNTSDFVAFIQEHAAEAKRRFNERRIGAAAQVTAPTDSGT